MVIVPELFPRFERWLDELLIRPGLDGWLRRPLLVRPQPHGYAVSGQWSSTDEGSKRRTRFTE